MLRSSHPIAFRCGVLAILSAAFASPAAALAQTELTRALSGFAGNYVSPSCLDDEGQARKLEITVADHYVPATGLFDSDRTDTMVATRTRGSILGNYRFLFSTLGDDRRESRTQSDEWGCDRLSYTLYASATLLRHEVVSRRLLGCVVPTGSSMTFSHELELTPTGVRLTASGQACDFERVEAAD